LGRSVCPGSYADLSQEWLGEFCMMLGAHLFGLLNVSQAGLEPVAVVPLHLFSQCNVAWLSFPQVRGSGCQSFDSPWCFISVNCGSSISARFWSHGAHTVWFCTLVAILDLSSLRFLLLYLEWASLLLLLTHRSFHTQLQFMSRVLPGHLCST
jgi:hypothetical protein